MARLSALDPASMNEEQLQVYQAIASGPRQGVRGPVALWLHSPQLADRAQQLGQFCRYQTRLPQRLSELAILVIATIWKSEYEWFAHKPLAINAGIAPEIVECLRLDKPPVFPRDDEAVVYDVITGLHRNRVIEDGLYNRAAALLEPAGLVELIGIAGYYTLISMTINVFEVGLPEGAEPELQAIDIHREKAPSEK